MSHYYFLVYNSAKLTDYIQTFLLFFYCSTNRHKKKIVKFAFMKQKKKKFKYMFIQKKNTICKILNTDCCRFPTFLNKFLFYLAINWSIQRKTNANTSMYLLRQII